MASIADVFRDGLPETSRIAAGIEKALRDVDVRATARKWGRDIDRELGKPEVEVTADTRPAERKIDELEPDRDRALEPAVRSCDETTVRGASHHQQCSGCWCLARNRFGRSRFRHRHPRRGRPMVGERHRRQFRQEPCFRPVRVALCDKHFPTVGCCVVRFDGVTEFYTHILQGSQ